MDFKFTEDIEEGQITVEYKICKGEKYKIVGKQIFNGEIREVASPELFYCEEESIHWCRFLCENKVLPSSLNQVLRDESIIFDNCYHLFGCR